MSQSISIDSCGLGLTSLVGLISWLQVHKSEVTHGRIQPETYDKSEPNCGWPIAKKESVTQALPPSLNAK